MARKPGGTILQEELYPSSAGPWRGEPVRHEAPQENSSREQLDDARLMDLDVDEESPFLRAQKRVPARRGALPRKAASRLLWGAIAATALCALVLLAATLYHYGEHSWRFRIDSSDNIQIAGMENVSKAQIMEVMGADIGRNIFFVPLTQQKAQLEQIPWVESASVMRFVPNRLEVEIHERTPVAFARIGPRIELIDAGGTLMELPQKHRYSFPVILGMNPGEPLSTRVPRMKAYNALVQELDSSGAHYSQDLSEIDLSDLDNVKVRVNDPAGDVLVELGSADYLKRYKTYISHAQEWRQQFQKLESVNLRYDNQVIVNPDMEGRPKQVALSATAARAAVAAGVKPAALITKIGPRDRGVPKPAFQLSEKKLDPKAAARKAAAKPRAKKAHGKTARPVMLAKAVPKHTTATPSAAARGDATKPETTKSGPPPAAAASSSSTPKPSPMIVKQPVTTSTKN
jgi:cell division protein FtsQ